MFYIVWFILVWLIWNSYADKKRWRELLPVCIFAAFLGIGTDELMHYYPLWEYVGSPLLIHLADDFGIYAVVTYLFIQWLPKQCIIQKMLLYWVKWTTVAIIIELIYVHFGYLLYHQWWMIWHSYAADWFLYWIFYKFHKILKLDKLS